MTVTDDDTSFLGTGWGFPPEFTRGGAQVGMVSDAQDIQQSLEILLSTQPGERVMREDFGCDLNSVAFDEMDQSLVNAITSVISNAILYYEPRIMLNDLLVSENKDQRGALFINIDYTIRNTNSRFNMVYPFYLDQATTL